MMNLEIMPVRRSNLGILVRRLRREHAALLVALGVDIHRHLSETVEASSWCRMAYVDGTPAAIWGVTGQLASSAGHVWLLLTQEILAHPFLIFRETIAQLTEMFQTFRRLETSILSGDKTALRFARVLGFHDKEEVVLANAKGTVLMMSLAREEDAAWLSR